MSRAGLDDMLQKNTVPRAPADNARNSGGESIKAPRPTGPGGVERRRTPRSSLIVVLPDNHVVSPDVLAERLTSDAGESMHVIVACAGQPTNLGALQRRIRDAQFLLAPAGTSTEDLRELAMRQTPADVVSLLSGVASLAPVEREISKSR
jgi:hypothetical protein